MAHFKVAVHTGDKKGAGTDANIWLRLQASDGERTPWERLDAEFRDDFQPAGVDEFEFDTEKGIKDILRVQLWRDEAGWSPDWYIDCVIVTYGGQEYPFPIYRWIPPRISFFIELYDAVLPQYSPTKEQRAQELERLRRVYMFETKIKGLPPQITNLPSDEEFSVEYIANLAEQKSVLRSEIFGGGSFRSWGFSSYGFPDRFADLQEVKEFYETYPSLPTPKCIDAWMEDSMFGALRLAGLNTRLIKLCTKLPDKLAVDPSEVAAFLEGSSLQEAIDAKKIFIVDYEILEGIQAKTGFTLTKPITLLYVRNDKKLVPIAIQLYQNPGTENPVFYPNDEPYLWLLAKLWCNNADAAYHQVIAHLGSTHLIMEPIYITYKRQISISHPLNKLLSPHFQFLLPVNWTGGLFREYGPLAKFMTVDYMGMTEIMRRKFADYDITQEGDLVNDMKARQVDDPLVLPNYHYRDDALLLYKAITHYVSNFVRHYYKYESDIELDSELQAWCSELSRSKCDNGCSIKGLPEHGKFSTYDELIAFIRYIIFTCTVEHAAVNTNAYEIYGFPLLYPSLLNGKPPTDKTERCAADLLNALPSRANVLETALTAKLLSKQHWKKLGDFDVPYIMDPVVLDNVVREFRRELEQISQEIKKRNETRTELDYTVLDPERISNYMPN